MAKQPNAVSKGRAAKGAREMLDQKKVRQSADAQMRFQGEDLEAGRRASPVPIPPMRPAGMAKGGGVKKMMAKKMAPKKKK